MGRIINPLTQMSVASIIFGNGCAPRSPPSAPRHLLSSPVASAQIVCPAAPDCMLDGKTSVTEPALSRNHGADAEILRRRRPPRLTTFVHGSADPDLHGNLVRVLDISSAAYFIAAALIVPGSEVLLKNVGINPRRDVVPVCRAPWVLTSHF